MNLRLDQKTETRKRIVDSATKGVANVFIYILPREIHKIVEAARSRALSVLVTRLAEAALNERIHDHG